MYLIPAPAKLEKKEGRFIWAYDRYVTVDQSCSQLVTRQASLFCDGAEKELGYRPLLTSQSWGRRFQAGRHHESPELCAGYHRGCNCTDR